MTNPTQKILVADDEPLYLRTTGDLLRKAGYACVCVSNATEAMRRLREESFDLVLSDLSMPGNFKLELLHDQRNHRPTVPIVVITGVPTLPSAIESIRLGITDYLLKPVKFEDLLACVRRVLASAENKSTRPPVPVRGRDELETLFPHMIGKSEPMLELFEIIDRVAPTDTNVLITGESGTGKEIVASTIHSHSHRSDGKFQVIDCTAVPESLFESMLFGHKRGSFTGAVGEAEGLLKQCDGGTAFIDELGELPVALQAKLLRAVQEQTFIPVGSHTPVTVDTRFVCATNRDLEMEVAAGRFRQDLYYRLGVIHIEMPPLRNRGNDILLLADALLDSLRPPNSAVEGFSDDAREALLQYDWPGNIRELRNLIERALTLAPGPLVTTADLPGKVHSSSASGSHFSVLREHVSSLDASPSPTATLPAALSNASREEAMEAAEYQYLVGLMEIHAGNVSEAARQAGLSRQGLHKLLKKHDINAAQFRS
ncbi:Transcriptional regulatory protein ZraR [Rosistilla ulvae]|uniref:Transcriptional regulatory protein ZraR n=1 Tax=Rosistilla ulvae TaxID=1930277 RepID=A0A517LZC1_9BACT|nr:sigma-54 dependent transcriptional regulator [Rosistilla ulvae]QDS87973.1 Transcriptional regulatory protein ZraR [Rosistilla ulvae]